MPIEVGDEFIDFRAFKAAMSDWSITGEHKFTFRYQKPDKTRNIVVCAHADCSFRVYAAMNRGRGMVEVTTTNPNQPYLCGSCDAAPQHSEPASLAAAHSPCNLNSHEESHIIRCQLHTLQQNALRGASWVTTWKARQCNFVCRLHMWIPSVLQTCEHMYC